MGPKNWPQGLTHFGNWYKDFHDIDINGVSTPYATILERRLLDGF